MKIAKDRHIQPIAHRNADALKLYYRPVSGLVRWENPRRTAPSHVKTQWQLPFKNSLTVAGAAPAWLNKAHRLPV